MNPTHYASMPAKTILNAVTAPSMPFDWSINPYRGCQHGCSFCYARSTHTYLGEAADDAFQRRIFWKENAPELLHSQLARMAKRGKLPRHVAIGTATDPYQQLEGRTRTTRSCLEVLAGYGVGVSITTRSPLVLRDLDILRRMPDISVNISIHTLDKGIWKAFEPSTPSPAQRLKCARHLSDAGVRVHAFVAPMLPYLTDSAESTDALLESLKESGINQMMSSFLRLSTPEVKSWFFTSLREAYPHLTEPYGRLYWQSSRLPDAFRRPVYTRIKQQMKHYGLAEIDHSTIPKSDGNAVRAGASSPYQARASVEAMPCQPVQMALF